MGTWCSLECQDVIMTDTATPLLSLSPTSGCCPGHPGHRLPASVPVLRAQAGGDTFLSLPWHARPPDGVRPHLCRYLLQSQLNLLTFCYCCIK